MIHNIYRHKIYEEQAYIVVCIDNDIAHMVTLERNKYNRSTREININRLQSEFILVDDKGNK